MLEFAAREGGRLGPPSRGRSASPDEPGGPSSTSRAAENTREAAMPKVTGCGEIEEIERGKVYRIRHHLGRDPKTGRYLRSPKRTVHGTKSDARRALEEYRHDLEEGFANPENLTVPELGWK